VSRLEDFLDKKPLFYSEIDTTLMQRAYDSISSYFDYSGTTVHLVGTNGKGSTGRYLATYLYKDNKKVGHYTSPHIDIFNERVWLNGELATDELLDIAHDKLQNILSQD
jgi:dihydrofolate synthase/folylpolyglutamate synthase